MEEKSLMIKVAVLAFVFFNYYIYLNIILLQFIMINPYLQDNLDKLDWELLSRNGGESALS